MKVLFLSWNFPPVLGGIEYVVEHLYKGLKKFGHNVSAITSHSDSPEGDSQVYRCKKSGLKSYVLYSLFASLKFCLRERPDIILCGSIVTAPAAFVSSLFLRIPYVVLMHGSDILYGGRIYQLCVRFLVKRASRLTANSENTKRLLIEAGCKAEKIDVIYPGVCAELYEKEPAIGCEEIFEKIRGKKVILSVGRLIKRKGVLEFVENVMPELIKRYPEVAYLVVGEDATKSLAHKDRLKDKIQTKINELNLGKNVFLLGKVSNNDLTKLYYHCDIFTLPCLDVPGDVEGFGIVFSEAALGGAASLATKIGGIPEAVLDGKTGLLVDVGDYSAMIDAAENLLQDESLRASLASAGAERAKKELSWPVITAKYAQSMEKSIKSSLKECKLLGLLFKVLIGIMLLIGILKIVYPLWVNHYGTINADSYTYTTFGRSISIGHFNLRGVLWDFIGENSKTGEVHQGIVWNTHILKNGAVACTVACGYPLFLALMFTLGGTWLMLHSNLLLLYGSLVACFLCFKEIYKKGINGTIFAGLSTLLVILINPSTFDQFSYPWREALFYTLILFGLFAVIKLINGGKTFWVIVAGLLLGFSCAVKEANIIYSIGIALAVIIEKKFWNRKNKGLIIALAIIAFLVGVLPLLLQNLNGTGNPFISLQTIRATASYANETWASGMNPHNAHDTIINYINLYSKIKFFAIPMIVLALVGMVASFVRSFGGRAVFFCVVFHLALYLQWGNADLRHMFFLNYFYAFYLIYGLFFIVEQVGKLFSRKYYQEMISLFGCLVLIGYVFKFSPYQVSPAKLNYENMQKLCLEVEEAIKDPDNSIVLVNRLFMEQLGAHTQLNIIRYHDLQRLMNPADIMDYFNSKDIKLYFIDNSDKDPKNRGLEDWSIEDYQLLSQFYNLDKTKTVDNKKYKAFGITNKENLSIYELNSWTNDVFETTINVPDEEIRFLYFDTKGITNNYELYVDNQVVATNSGNYHLVDNIHFENPTARITFKLKDGSPVFADTLTKLISKGETIKFRHNYKLLPGESRDFNIPITCCSNAVPAIYAELLCLNRAQKFVPLQIYINNKEVHRNVYQTVKDIYIFDYVKTDCLKSLFVNLTIKNRTKTTVRINNLQSMVAHKSLKVETSEDAIGFVATCTVFPLESATSGLTVIKMDDRIIDTWFRKDIRQGAGCLLASMDMGNPPQGHISIENGAMLDYSCISVDLPFSFKPDSVKVGFVKSLFYPLEEDVTGVFRWTVGNFRFVLPTREGIHYYKLKIKARDGYITPGERKITISVDSAIHETTFSNDVKEYEFDFYFENPETGLVPLKISVPSWSPQEVLGVNDARKLGIIFYGLDWDAFQE